MEKKIRVGIVGSTGYGGVELIRLLQHHPHVDITSVISSSSAGRPITEGFPHLHGIVTQQLDDVDTDLIRGKADVVFTATPSGVSSKLCPAFIDAGLKVIDLSGDFRLPHAATYEQWYGHPAAPKPYLDQAVYGLSEIFAKDIIGAEFIANPGCYPTAALLGIIPALQSGWIDADSLIIDAKTGVSGGGRKTSLGFHFSEANENFRAYKVNVHQHTPEIERGLKLVSGRDIVTTFTPHLVPMTRGIMCTVYAKLDRTKTDADFIEYYREFYQDRPFVRIRPAGEWPATKEVYGSNYCDIGFSADARTGRVTIISVIDNVVKGAAGQAIQNLNLMMGLDESEGLRFAPVYP